MPYVRDPRTERLVWVDDEDHGEVVEVEAEQQGPHPEHVKASEATHDPRLAKVEETNEQPSEVPTHSASGSEDATSEGSDATSKLSKLLGRKKKTKESDDDEQEDA